LSFDGLSNGEKLPHNVEGTNKWSKNGVSKTQRVYNEEIEGGRSSPPNNRNMSRSNPKQSQNDNGKQKEIYVSE